MNVAIVNMTHKGSTGRIMLNIAQTARKEGHNVKTYSPVLFSRVAKEKEFVADNHYTWGSRFGYAFHYYCGTALGLNGFFSYTGTRKLIRDLKKFKPDIIHLHNLHNFSVNLPLLFNYIKKARIKVIWTLHDCWAFTGHCPHFTVAGCDKWKTGCNKCSQLAFYPKSYVDTSKLMYSLKKKWFTGIENMTIVTPSKWLADIVAESFLGKYSVVVINNGINLEIFKATENNCRHKYGIPEERTILLGVSLGWSERKGLDVFIELSKRLDDEKYQIVLVGTNDRTDESLPDSIISIHQTSNPQELAEIYSVADLFVNPTREETYPTVNMESIACGTPVLTFRTGGSPEILDNTTGSVVECDDIDSMINEINRICNDKPYSRENCLVRAKSFDMNDRFKEYVKLYEDCTHST